jgi:trimeric autotransporter adhesin
MTAIKAIVVLDKGVSTAGNASTFLGFDASSSYSIVNSVGQVIAVLSDFNPVTAIPGNAFAATVTGGAILTELKSDGTIDLSSLISLVGNAVTICGTVAGLVMASPAVLTGFLVVGVVVTATGLAVDIWDKYHPDSELKIDVHSLYDSARNLVLARRDPLVFDLDGDGVETINVSAGIKFDQNADGVKTATGWVSADDAFLVLDRNGNGVIDNGRELFGDSTQLADGSLADDGFAALAGQDSNGDGVIDAADANFSKLRLWRDLNQDGVSQANELFSLADAGIASINVGSSANSQTLANGNQIADLGSYTRSDGSTGTVGEVTGDLADLNLAENPFYSEFTDPITLTEQAAALPGMNGSGLVRDLQEAMSLGTAAADELADLVSQFAQATSAEQQKALLDQILVAWGKTSTLAVSGSADAYNGLPTSITIAGASAGSAAYQEWLTKLQTLECFNGSNFVIPAANATSVTVNLFQQRLDLLQQSWEALEQSVYSSLVLQTRLKPYLDSVSLSISSDGIALDFSGINAALDAKFASDPVNAVLDGIELSLFASDLASAGWDAKAELEPMILAVVESGSIDQLDSVSAFYDWSEQTLKLGTSGNDTISGGADNDLVFGNDKLKGRWVFEGAHQVPRELSVDVLCHLGVVKDSVSMLEVRIV